MNDKATGLERESLVIKGVRSELRLEGGVITIVKQATTQAHPTTVTIDVKKVRGSTVEAPRRGGGRGWLHIATVNGSPAPVGELSASGDPYALPITARQVGPCRKLAKMIDRHVKDRGMPADVGPNQGRFSSGVVMSTAVKPVSTPMVTMPESEPDAEPASPAAETSDSATPAARKSAKKTAAKKATVTRKATAKKGAAKKATVTRKSTARKAASRGAVASELVAQLRELGELHAAGVLDDAEFAAAKAKLLA